MTRVTELDIFNVCHGTYEDGYPFDLVFQGEKDAETYVGIKRFGALDVVAFRGSTTILDWLRNFCAVPVYDEGLGWVDEGFHVGLHEVMGNLTSVIGRNWIVTGHSRGAAQALDFAAEMTIRGRPPLAAMVLAPPRPGRTRMAQVLKDVPIRAYRNQGDPVCEVPSWFTHPCPLIDIDVPARFPDPWGPVAPHHSELYGAAIAALDPMPVYTIPELAEA